MNSNRDLYALIIGASLASLIWLIAYYFEDRRKLSKVPNVQTKLWVDEVLRMVGNSELPTLVVVKTIEMGKFIAKRCKEQGLGAEFFMGASRIQGVEALKAGVKVVAMTKGIVATGWRAEFPINVAILYSPVLDRDILQLMGQTERYGGKFFVDGKTTNFKIPNHLKEHQNV
jgi:hypothetical protein